MNGLSLQLLVIALPAVMAMVVLVIGFFKEDPL
jgi:hypothetical protein